MLPSFTSPFLFLFYCSTNINKLFNDSTEKSWIDSFIHLHLSLTKRHAGNLELIFLNAIVTSMFFTEDNDILKKSQTSECDHSINFGVQTSTVATRLGQTILI